MVVHLTVGLAAILIERTTSKALLAVLAYEVLRVPLGAKRIDTLSLYRLIARVAARGKYTVKTTLAIRPGIFLEECTALKRLEALGANEVMYVPLSAQGRDAPIENRLITMRASSTEELLVASLAMRETILFEEVCSP